MPLIHQILQKESLIVVKKKIQTPIKAQEMNLDDVSLASLILEWPPSFTLVGFVYGLFVYNPSFLKGPEQLTC